MSHFVVAVLSHSPGEVEDLLAPYSENDEAYYEFHEEDVGVYRLDYETNEKLQKDYPTFCEYLENEWGYEYNPVKNVYGRYYNPNAQWDWWTIGGRWDGILSLKPHTQNKNQAQIKDVIFSQNTDAYAEAIRFWDIVVEGAPLRDGETIPLHLDSSYYVDQFGTKERFAQVNSSLSVWAIVTPDGEWIENGKMGYFGIGDATIESREQFAKCFNEIVVQGDPELYITIVDCHI